jgi:hypothetical protein
VQDIWRQKIGILIGFKNKQGLKQKGFANDIRAEWRRSIQPEKTELRGIHLASFLLDDRHVTNKVR